MSDQYNAQVLEKRYVTDTLFFMKVMPDAGFVPFTAGQYVALGLIGDAARCASLVPEEVPQSGDALIRRTYSIGSAPTQTDGYEFFIAMLPQGILTARLAALQPGDRLFVGKKPIGTFCLTAIPEGSPVVFVATGTGVAPYVSMLREGKIFEGRDEIVLLHGVRYASDFGYLEELTELASQHSNFSYHPIISRASEGWEGPTGYVQDFILNDTVTVDPARHHVMLCGNPNMIDDLETLLVGKQFSVNSRKEPGNLHLEKYW
jgi:ferredoxin--NADP+ reductase